MAGGMTGEGGGTAARKDPLVSVHFYLTIQGHIDNMIFRECSGIGSESEVIEYKASGKADYHSIQQIPGRLKWQKINLKRGLTDSMEAWTWRRMVEEGQVETARADGTIFMVNQMGEPVAQWNFFRAWPSKLTGPSLNSTSNEVAVEELEIVHERLVRVKI